MREFSPVPARHQLVGQQPDPVTVVVSQSHQEAGHDEHRPCTPKHEFLGFSPNGKQIVFAEHVFYRFREDRIAEVWSLIDRSAIESQLRSHGAKTEGPYPELGFLFPKMVLMAGADDGLELVAVDLLSDDRRAVAD